MILDRYGKPVEGAPRHRRAVGFVATTVPIREDEDVVHGISPPKDFSPDPLRMEWDPVMAKSKRP